MITPTTDQRKVGESIDRLIAADGAGRGVIDELYPAARALHDGPLCLEAAARLLSRVSHGDPVVLATGFPMYPWFIGEQDGPVGAATLARALVLARGARPVIVTDPVNVDLCAAAVRGAGLYVRPLGDALGLPTTAAVLPFPLEWTEAEERTREVLETLRPAALIAVERPGANEHRHYHSAGGKSLTAHCGKIDPLFAAARAAGVLTIAVADGGNELGCAPIRETILRTVPHARRCACPCAGTVVPEVAAEVLVAAGISNWGAYGIEAAMALLLGRPEVLHDRHTDARAHDRCADAGANNDGPGLLDPGADAVPARLHGHLVDLLGQVVAGGLDLGRLYREPRYPWL
ncbi:MAG TPA: glutamate cyclase domain-containing protein [bacterium]|nr:glutamate cyclase domain-containing protein [bacterium]